MTGGELPEQHLQMLIANFTIESATRKETSSSVDEFRFGGTTWLNDQAARGRAGIPTARVPAKAPAGAAAQDRTRAKRNRVIPARGRMARESVDHRRHLRGAADRKPGAALRDRHPLAWSAKAGVCLHSPKRANRVRRAVNLAQKATTSRNGSNTVQKGTSSTAHARPRQCVSVTGRKRMAAAVTPRLRPFHKGIKRGKDI